MTFTRNILDDILLISSQVVIRYTFSYPGRACEDDGQETHINRRGGLER